MAHVFKLSAGAKIFVVIAVVFFLGAVGYVVLVKSAEAKISPPEPTGSATGIPATQIDQSKGHTEKLKSQQASVKGIRSELDDVKEMVKNIDTTTLDALLNQWEACIQARWADVGKDVFGTNIEECYSLNTSVEDEFYKNIVPQKNCAEIKIKTNAYKKGKKNMERQIQDILRIDKNVDAAALREIISQMDALLTKADPLNCNGDGKDSLAQIQEELGALSSDFSNIVSDLQNNAIRKSNFESMVKRPCADTSAFLNKLEKQMKVKAKKYPGIYADVESKINSMREINNQRCGDDLLNQMKAALQNNDADAYNDAYSIFNDLGTEWGDIQTSFYEADQQASDIDNVKNIGKELKQQISELKARKKGQLLKYKKAYARASKKVISSEDQKKNLDAFDGYIRQADELLAKMSNGIKKVKQAQNNPDPALVEEIREVQNEFSEMQEELTKLTNIMTRLVPGIGGLGTAEPFGGLESIRRATNNDPELMNVLDGIASQANDLLNQAWKIAITSPDEALDLLNSRQDLLHYDWTDAVDSWKESHGIEEFDYSGGPPSGPPVPPVGR